MSETTTPKTRLTIIADKMKNVRIKDAENDTVENPETAATRKAIKRLYTYAGIGLVAVVALGTYATLSRKSEDEENEVVEETTED